MQYFLQDISSFDAQWLDSALPKLPAALQESLKKIGSQQHKIEKAATYILLTESLKKSGLYSGLPVIAYAADGKPYLENYPGLHFNQSHCKEAVAVAFSNAPVGIDAECRHKLSDALIEKVCDNAEKEAIGRSNDPELEFVRLWTRKEAYLKYTGEGLQDDLPSYPLAGRHKIETHPLPDGNGWVSICFCED